MNSVVVAFLLVIVTTLAGTEALKCKAGCGAGTQKTVDCNGSCMKISTGGSDLYGCTSHAMSDGCHESMGVKACFCNTDLCDPARRSDIQTFFAYIGLKFSPAEDTVRDGGLEKL